MEYKARTLEELSAKTSRAAEKHALLGFDGFVDKIMKVVNSRQGQGRAFEAMSEITQFGNRINAAAGESANIELYPEMEKLGGNGPIMGNAVRAAGIDTTYVGALGQPIDPVFADFAQKCKVVSICNPGITHALEFDDGKIMLGVTAPLDDVTYDRIVDSIGEGVFFDMISRADLIGLVNWTMIPNMTTLFNDLLTKVLPNLGPKENGRCFFFDLADPAKRSQSDLLAVLKTIARFCSFGSVTLGLNLAEARQVSRVLNLTEDSSSPEEIRLMAERIREALDLTCVVVHPRHGAAASTKEGSWWVQGPLCAKPLISTGAGDHFNAGFATAQVIGLSTPACLTVAVATSGQYVRTAKSPSLYDTARFIESWS
ncbi:MAG: PfkB family carbohydrate kinase [Verrucomicrobiota bacterium JB022]|nr:PfkB family carbohydrate kinase [Verrucomicrobiota bacterium JB022]